MKARDKSYACVWVDVHGWTHHTIFSTAQNARYYARHEAPNLPGFASLNAEVRVIYEAEEE